MLTDAPVALVLGALVLGIALGGLALAVILVAGDREACRR